MERITNNDLEFFVNRINEVTKSPAEPTTRNADGTFSWNIDNYHIVGAYGGVKLVRVVSDGGGIATISSDGFGTKRELYNWMGAFLEGLQYKAV